LEAINSYASVLDESCLSTADATKRTRELDNQVPACLVGLKTFNRYETSQCFDITYGFIVTAQKDGAVADCVRHARSAYHYAIRRVKKDEESILRERIADCMLQHHELNFWQEIKENQK
jgi:hypothetical protein